MNSRDLYPHSKASMAKALNRSVTWVNSRTKEMKLTQADCAYLDRTEHFTPQVFERLKELEMSAPKRSAWGHAKSYNGEYRGAYYPPAEERPHMKIALELIDKGYVDAGVYLLKKDNNNV
jgi:hypothetical protein